MDPSPDSERASPPPTGEPAHTHAHRHSVVNRLARIEGHVRAIKRMVEDDSPCPDTLLQIAAVRAALDSVARIILEDHLESCMVSAVEGGEFQQAFADLKRALDRLLG